MLELNPKNSSIYNIKDVTLNHLNRKSSANLNKENTNDSSLRKRISQLEINLKQRDSTITELNSTLERNSISNSRISTVESIPSLRDKEQESTIETLRTELNKVHMECDG